MHLCCKSVLLYNSIILTIMYSENFINVFIFSFFFLLGQLLFLWLTANFLLRKPEKKIHLFGFFLIKFSEK